MDFYEIVPSTILVVLILAFIVTCIVTWFILRKKKKRFAALILLLFFLYGILSIFVTLFIRNLSADLLAWPIYFLRVMIPVLTGLLLAFRFFPSYVFGGLRSESTPDYSLPAVLRDSVSKILDSDNFLTALRSTLPKGQADETFGFDYIPFMLNSIDERRRRAIKSARFFLLATTVSALIFSGVVMYFGYILVNEASAGTAKSLADIKASTESTTEALRSIIPSYFNNPKFQQDVAPRLEKLVQLEPTEKNRPVRDKLAAAINEAKKTGNFGSLSETLTQAGTEVSREGIDEREYSLAVIEANSSMKEFMSLQTTANPTLASTIDELKKLIPKAEKI